MLAEAIRPCRNAYHKASLTGLRTGEDNAKLSRANAIDAAGQRFDVELPAGIIRSFSQQGVDVVCDRVTEVIRDVAVRHLLKQPLEHPHGLVAAFRDSDTQIGDLPACLLLPHALKHIRGYVRAKGICICHSSHQIREH